MYYVMLQSSRKIFSLTFILFQFGSHHNLLVKILWIFFFIFLCGLLHELDCNRNGVGVMILHFADFFSGPFVNDGSFCFDVGWHWITDINRTLVEEPTAGFVGWKLKELQVRLHHFIDIDKFGSHFDIVHCI